MIQEAQGSESIDQVLEQDMRRLAKEIQATREMPENKNLDERELLRQSLGRVVPRAQEQAPAVSSPSAGPLPSYSSDISAETKLEVEYLMDLALHQGIEKELKRRGLVS